MPEFRITYTGKQYFNNLKVKDYLLFSTSLCYQIKPETIIFIDLNNITGKNYYLAPEYPGRPFDFIAGLKIKW